MILTFKDVYSKMGSLLTGKKTTSKLSKEKRKKTVNKSQIKRSLKKKMEKRYYGYNVGKQKGNEVSIF